MPVAEVRPAFFGSVGEIKPRLDVPNRNGKRGFNSLRVNSAVNYETTIVSY